MEDRLAELYRTDGQGVRATLIRLLGDFDLAEEALQEAFAAALVQWPREGMPENPRAWLASTGRFRAIDELRRRARFDASVRALAAELEGAVQEPLPLEDSGIPDDRLRLIFTCCHPILSTEAQLALTLREMCALTTEEVARAFLVRPATVAQRIVRAKARLRDGHVPYEVPEPAQLPERLSAVLHVIYLLFNEGYAATAGEAMVRADLAGEAIRLGRVLVELLPEPEALGLLALMLLHHSRRHARTDDAGDLVLLEDQDRALWDREAIAEGLDLVKRALDSGRVGPMTVQAAIAAAHARAPAAEHTDWREIVALYSALHAMSPSPVVALNRAVAVAMRDGPEAGLEAVDAVLGGGGLDGYPLAHAARADLCRRLGRVDEARAAYRRALELTRQEPERRFLERRLTELDA